MRRDGCCRPSARAAASWRWSRCRRPAIIAEMKRHGVDLGGAESGAVHGAGGRITRPGAGFRQRQCRSRPVPVDARQLLGSWPNYDPNHPPQASATSWRGRGGEGNFETAVNLLDWWLSRFIRLVRDAKTFRLPRFFQANRPHDAAPGRPPALITGCNHGKRSSRLFARVASANLDRKQAWATAWLVLAAPGR